MSPGTALFTYVWHYLVARLLYVDLLRPLVRAHPAGLAVAAGIIACAFLIGRRRGRRA
jgi:hypothetical protein